MWKTEYSPLKAKKKEIHSPFAGEMSGHIFFADDYFGFDDAIYPSGRLLEIISKIDKKLSELIDKIPYFISTPEIRVDCSDDAKFDVVADLAKSFKAQYETIDIDGARVLFGNGWGLVRASNTQPILVLRFKAKIELRLNKIKEI